MCDIVEQPNRVAGRAAYWLARGWCVRTIFNLKLSMKKRFQEEKYCLAHIDPLSQEAGIYYVVNCRHLYHDREENTVYLRRGTE